MLTIDSSTSIYSRWLSRYEQLARVVFGEAAVASPERLEMATRLVTLNLLAALLVPCFMVEFALIGHSFLAMAIGPAGLAMLASVPLYRAFGRISLARDTFLVGLFVFKTIETLYIGSLQSPGVVWYCVIPVVGVLLGGARAGLIWLSVTICTIFLLLFIQYDLSTASVSFWEGHLFAFSLSCTIIALFIFVLMAELNRKKSVRGLEQAHADMKVLAQRDPLTGLFNRRFTWDFLERYQQSVRSRTALLAIFLIDVDHFKAINDTYGHNAGDEVLRQISRSLELAVPPDGLVGRYGGEEFIVILHGIAGGALHHAGEALRHAVANLDFDMVEGSPKVTVSIGAAHLDEDESFVEGLKRADRALYAAKNGGRNRVVEDQEDHRHSLAGQVPAA